ncbi:glycosyltransferase [Ornithinibacillus sp. 179-J 7C1 HS]|uniref:CgeB family protein n=1 Tax=Ornithinibacillus sp. 179-J 7C1 HS TaxID=3142384 RepID=UPI0039A2FEAD
MTNRYYNLYKTYRKDLVSLSNPDKYRNDANSRLEKNVKVGRGKNFIVDLVHENWFYGKLPVFLKSNNSSMEINHKQIKSDFFYLSFKENNLDFSKAPVEYNFGLKDLKNYFVKFLGNTERNVRVELFIIYYKDNKKVNIDSFLINSSRVIKVNNQYDSVRIAIRIAGQGVTNIDLIQIIDMDNYTEEIGKISQSETQDVIDISEYNWMSFKEIKDFSQREWYLKDRKYIKHISFGNNMKLEADFGKNDFKYLSYMEKNVDFSRSPLSNESNISPNYNFEIKFNGKKQDTIRVELFIVFYSKGKKEQIETLLLNEKRHVKLKSSIDKYRIAIKFSGVGKVEINDIVIKQKKEIGFLPFSVLRKIGFDNPKTINESKIAVIADDFTLACLGPESNLITFGPEDWKAILEINKPHLLFVESAWHGNGGRWTRKVSYINNTNTLQLEELVKWCKDNNIPTVFWNKEDPVHFNSFIETAKYFDYIFTTDQNSVVNYKKLVEHNNVYPLPFAAQPEIHNPIQEYKRLDKASFAGSYYANKYLERQKDMNILLESAAKYGLDIFDRNYGKDLVEFYYPENLRKHVVGNLKPTEISRAYKGYKLALNVNSVIDSPTMFSRRVFECLASNTPVISTYSKGIENLLGNSVFMANDREGFNEIFDNLLNNTSFYKQKAHLGYREVMLSHTYSERLKFIFSAVGINVVEKRPVVGVLSIVNTREEFNNIVEMYLNQNYTNKKLFAIVPEGLKKVFNSSYQEKDIVIFTKRELTNDFRKNDISYVSLFNSSNKYGENYLVDLLLASKYSKAQIIGKRAFYSLDDKQGIILNDLEKEHCYVENLKVDRSIINEEILNKISNNDILEIANGSIKLSSFFSKGYRLYSADVFNFIDNRKNISDINSKSVMI